MQTIRVVAVGLLIAAGMALSTLVSADEMSRRTMLKAAMPIAVEVLEVMETARGARFSDGEIPAILRTREFQERLDEAVTISPQFRPCRIEECKMTQVPQVVAHSYSPKDLDVAKSWRVREAARI